MKSLFGMGITLPSNFGSQWLLTTYWNGMILQESVKYVHWERSFFFGSSGKCQSPSKMRISSEHDAVFLIWLPLGAVYLHKSGICQVVVSDSLILVINPSQRHFSGVIPEKLCCALMPLPTTVCNKVPKKKAQGLHSRSMINDAYPSRIHKKYQKIVPPTDWKDLTVNISYIRLNGCNVFIYIVLTTPLIKKKHHFRSISCLDVEGRTLLLPMARLPSSTVAQTLVKGLQVASQQGAIPVRCFFIMAGSTYPPLHPPRNPPSVLNKVLHIKGLLTALKRTTLPKLTACPW